MQAPTTLDTSNGNGNIYLWDVATHKITATLTNPRGKSIAAVVFGPGGTTLATGDGSTFPRHLTKYMP